MEKKQNQNQGSNTGKTVNLQGTAKMKVNVTAHGRQYGRDMQLKHQILEEVRRIQPLPIELQRNSQNQFVSKAYPECTLKLEYKTRTARAIAAIRHTANKAWTLISDWARGINNHFVR
jgi:hypothetical protein